MNEATGILEQIESLVAAGNTLDEILVDYDNDAWGCDSAHTRASWAITSATFSYVPELPTAAEWLAAR